MVRGDLLRGEILWFPWIHHGGKVEHLSVLNQIGPKAWLDAELILRSDVIVIYWWEYLWVAPLGWFFFLDDVAIDARPLIRVNMDRPFLKCTLQQSIWRDYLALTCRNLKGITVMLNALRSKLWERNLFLGKGILKLWMLGRAVKRIIKCKLNQLVESLPSSTDQLRVSISRYPLLFKVNSSGHALILRAS